MWSPCGVALAAQVARNPGRRAIFAAMNDPVDSFFSQCQAMLAGDATLLARLRAAGFACQDGHWEFRLPALHRWLAPQMDYPRFRQALYASELNTRLQALGGEFAIVDNRGNVDLSLYCLRRLA
jgi:hypothetical protein